MTWTKKQHRQYYEDNKVVILARTKLWKENNRARVNELNGIRRNPNYLANKLNREQKKISLENLRIEKINNAIESYLFTRRKHSQLANNFFAEQMKKAYAYDRRKVWKQLKKDLIEIMRMRIAA